MQHYHLAPWKSISLQFWRYDRDGKDGVDDAQKNVQMDARTWNGWCKGVAQDLVHCRMYHFGVPQTCTYAQTIQEDLIWLHSTELYKTYFSACLGRTTNGSVLCQWRWADPFWTSNTMRWMCTIATCAMLCCQGILWTSLWLWTLWTLDWGVWCSEIQHQPKRGFVKPLKQLKSQIVFAMVCQWVCHNMLMVTISLIKNVSFPTKLMRQNSRLSYPVLTSNFVSSHSKSTAFYARIYWHVSPAVSAAGACSGAGAAPRPKRARMCAFRYMLGISGQHVQRHHEASLCNSRSWLRLHVISIVFQFATYSCKLVGAKFLESNQWSHLWQVAAFSNH